MARSLFSRLGTACLLYLYVINVIYLVPNKAVKKKEKKKNLGHEVVLRSKAPIDTVLIYVRSIVRLAFATLVAQAVTTVYDSFL
jgi:hypothetical protein